MTTDISSVQNPKVKRLLALQQKSSERRQARCFVVEGLRELRHCMSAGFQIETLFVCPDFLREEDLAPLLHASSSAEKEPQVFTVSGYVYEKIAYRGSTEGVVAIVRTRHLTLDDLHLSDHPLVVVLESVEKPGNLGAVLRSADAASSPLSCKTPCLITIPTCVGPPPSSWARSLPVSPSSGVRQPTPISASPCLAVSTRSMSLSVLPFFFSRP